MDDDIRRKLQGAAQDLGDGGDPAGALGRAARTWTRRRARTTVATFALVAVAVTGVLRMAGDEPAGSLIDPAAPGDDRQVVTPTDEPNAVSSPSGGGVSASSSAVPHPSGSAEPERSAIPRRRQPQPAREPSSCPRMAPGGEAPRGVTVTVDLANQSFLPGEPITFMITVRNDGTTPVTFQRGSQEFELVVNSGADGRSEWIYSHNLVFTQEIRQDALQPGESRTRSAVWDQSTCAGDRVAPGGYSVLGWWKAYSDDGGSGWMAESVPRFVIGA